MGGRATWLPLLCAIAAGGVWAGVVGARRGPLLAVAGVSALVTALAQEYVDARRARERARLIAAERAARRADIAARYAVSVEGGVVVSRGADGVESSIPWAELDEVLLGEGANGGETLPGWILRSGDRECFVPDYARGEKALRGAIYSLPGYFEQASVGSRRAMSLWRRLDPYPKLPADDDDV